LHSSQYYEVMIQVTISTNKIYLLLKKITDLIKIDINIQHYNYIFYILLISSTWIALELVSTLFK